MRDDIGFGCLFFFAELIAELSTTEHVNRNSILAEIKMICIIDFQAYVSLKIYAKSLQND